VKNATDIPPVSLQVSDHSTHNDDDPAGLVSAVTIAPVGSERLVHERVSQFTKLLPEVLNSEGAETVHDLRVCSRRIQQVLVTMFPIERESRANQVIRAVRQARRGLSGWRDCDVVMALLDRKLRRLRDPDERQAWGGVRDYLVKRREKEIRRARRRLAKRKLFTLGQETNDLMKDRGLNSTANVDVADLGPIMLVEGFIKTAYSDWQAGLTAAAESDNPTNVHLFRTKIKKLRYRMELARDLGDEEVALHLLWLKSLQDRLGHWHDRAQLARIAIEALTRADLLLTAPRPSGLLLKRLARELLSETTKVKSLLASVKNGNELLQLETWVVSHSKKTYPKSDDTAPSETSTS
jgi:CHAD domain-containing protein